MTRTVRVGVFSAFFLAFLLAGPALAQQKDNQKAPSQWAPSASFQLGEFNTTQTSSWFESLFGLQTDIRGRNWDVGVTRGRPGHSYLRISYAEIRVKDGSWTDDGNIRSVTDGVKIRGVKFERMWRLGPSRWKVAPTLELHGGVGKISGSVTQTETYEDFVQVAPGQYEFVYYPGEPFTSSAKELLGLEWIPIGGLSLGVAADLGDRFTVLVRAYGLEFPGTYAGAVEFTYWPRRSK